MSSATPAIVVNIVPESKDNKVDRRRPWSIRALHDTKYSHKPEPIKFIPITKAMITEFINPAHVTLARIEEQDNYVTDLTM